jgi:dipeptidyl aminopeptidase/acylaminoacyl peptidase
MLRLVAWLLLVPFVSLCFAVAPPVTSFEPWTPDDIIDQSSTADFQFSPDGRFIVWAHLTADKEKNARISQLHRLDHKTGREVQLTRGHDSCTSPRWSPEGTYLAFLTHRAIPKSKDKRTRKDGDADDAKTQIWLLDASGGEAWPVTEGERDVQAFEWISEDAIVFTAKEDANRREKKLDDDKDTSNVVEDDPNEPVVRLFRVEVKEKKVSRLTMNRDRIAQIAASPDGKWLVAQHERSLRYLYDNKIKPIVMLHDLKKGTSVQILKDPKLNPSAFVWAHDSSGFYFTNEFNSKPQLSQGGVTELHWLERKSLTDTRLNLTWPRGLLAQEENGGVAGVVALKDGFLALLADGALPRVARYTRKGDAFSRSWFVGECASHLYGFAASADGKNVVLQQSTASSPTTTIHATLTGNRLSEAKVFAEINEHLRKRKKAASEVVRWRGAKNDEIEGILFYPHDWKPGKKAPLIVQIHGGPAAADFDKWDESWAYSANLACQRGAFVLRPNYHGSTCYGLEFLESICDGKYCEPEIEDIEKGVDALIERGLVDREKLALSGWSNGGILTTQLISKTTRYKAAITGAGSSEYISDWASCEFGEAFNRYYLGKSPLEDVRLYLEKSPFYRLSKVTTPTLILFGEEDRVVHPQQGWALYRGMQQLGKAPVRFVTFPGEKHSPRKLAHQKRKIEEEFAWLDRHLFGTGVSKEEIVKEDSPLDVLLKARESKRSGGAYGVVEKGVLTPEVVRYPGLPGVRVGRFEVTRAQFAKYDANFRVETGKENYPAAGITYEQAQSYCKWLSRQTGRKVRLPNEKEAETLYEESKEGENTLDLWAGYAVNPEDAEKLRAKLKGIGLSALLKEVGTSHAGGKDSKSAIFDLGGNVGEWTTDKDGNGVICGGSADQPSDAKRKRKICEKECRGLRIVVDD